MRTLTFKRVIGQGAMGTVYLAELRVPGGFRRVCAVKVIKNVGPDREHFVSRMRDEARLLGMLQDEQVLGVSELVVVEGRDAVIMEFVDGVDLSELLEQHRVPPKALAELGAEIAGTLFRAHSALHPQTRQPLNVIHRDIKPANVMITARGGVRLLDFGVARAAFDSRESETQGLVLGTLNYFPPEVIAGDEPTTAVDIYGLGITLWECATGQQWGPPRVQQARYERKVDQAIALIEAEHKALVPVLRQILQWDPELRPDGGAAERTLLHAADGSTGQGLRTWARIVVPEMLASKSPPQVDDPLVGGTFEIHSFAADRDPSISSPSALLPPSQSPAAHLAAPPAHGSSAPANRRPAKAGFPWIAMGIGVAIGLFALALILGALVAVLAILVFFGFVTL